MNKIYFNNKYGLNQAVLEGRKTMTRRLVHGLPDNVVKPIGVIDKGVLKGCFEYLYGNNAYGVIKTAYHINEEVAVAQTYSELREVLAARDFKRTDTLYDAFYRAMQFGRACDTDYGWNNKQGVRADLMPHRIRITHINVERLQEISEEDCLCEGVEKWLDCYIVTGIMEHNGKNNVCFNNPRDAFSVLIDKISGKGTWQRNPWVFVYSFELIQ